MFSLVNKSHCVYLSTYQYPHISDVITLPLVPDASHQEHYTEYTLAVTHTLLTLEGDSEKPLRDPISHIARCTPASSLDCSCKSTFWVILAEKQPPTLALFTPDSSVWS